MCLNDKEIIASIEYSEEENEHKSIYNKGRDDMKQDVLKRLNGIRNHGISNYWEFVIDEMLKVIKEMK